MEPKSIYFSISDFKFNPFYLNILKSCYDDIIDRSMISYVNHFWFDEAIKQLYKLSGRQ